MSGGRERIKPEVVQAVEEAARMRILAPTDKELIARHGISRTSIHRIIRAARKRLHDARMEQLSQSEK